MRVFGDKQNIAIHILDFYSSLSPVCLCPDTGDRVGRAERCSQYVSCAVWGQTHAPGTLGTTVELETKVHKVFTIMEKAPTSRCEIDSPTQRSKGKGGFKDLC